MVRDFYSLMLQLENPMTDSSAAKEVSKARRRVLLVSYTFPPVGGAGVQRVTKFVKHLPRFGWDVSVLTAENPSVPVLDQSLASDVPAETKVFRARTWEPSYKMKSQIVGDTPTRQRAIGRLLGFVKGGARRLAGLMLQPDPQVLWHPRAKALGRSVLANEKHDAILVSGPPFSSFLLGASLSKRSGVPLVLDYRDEWGLSNQYWENKRGGRFAAAWQERQQRRVLGGSSAVIATTHASAKHLAELCASHGKRMEVATIYNGYDPDDFSEFADCLRGQELPCRFRLMYVGTLWNLTTARPILAATRVLAERSPELLKLLTFVCVGRRTPAEQQILRDLEFQGVQIEEHGYVDHAKAVQMMRSADELCAILADVPGAERVLPAKVFEYIATRRPILGISPRGELWDVLQTYSSATAIEPSDTAGLAQHLERRITTQRQEDAMESPGAGFDRISQAERLAKLLDGVLAGAN